MICPESNQKWEMKSPILTAPLWEDPLQRHLRLGPLRRKRPANGLNQGR